MNHRLDERLAAASSAYEEGYSCAQAVLAAYAAEMGISQPAACRMMAGFSQGMGGSKGMCGVIAAASVIISYLSSDGKPSADCRCACDSIRRAQEIFQREYGGIICRELLRGQEPMQHCCQMKVKDMILIIEQILTR